MFHSTRTTFGRARVDDELDGRSVVDVDEEAVLGERDRQRGDLCARRHAGHDDRRVGVDRKHIRTRPDIQRAREEVVDGAAVLQDHCAVGALRDERVVAAAERDGRHRADLPRLPPATARKTSPTK